MTVDNAEASRASIGTRRFGYAIAVGINVLLVVVVNNLLDWGWLKWLTPEFEKLLPVINLALGVNIVLNFLYMAYDEPPLKAATQIIVNLIAIAVLVRTLQVYPFDFSAYDFPIDISAFDLTWDLVARLLIGLAILGTAIAVVTETVKLSRALDRP
jgi:hypothetical protein